jgi:hypothetical protein
MSVHDAEPGDIYVDNQGKLWRVVWKLDQPSVGVEEVEGRAPMPQSAYANQAAQAQAYQAPRPVELIRAQQSGGVSGCMWEGFKRIWRKEAQG